MSVSRVVDILNKTLRKFRNKIGFLVDLNNLAIFYG